MQVITPGHKYVLDNFENKDQRGQVLQFIEKSHVADTTEQLQTINDGTTNEEVLLMMIDRMKFLNEALPSRETALSITNLEQALMWLEKRTAERKKRGVEGTHSA